MVPLNMRLLFVCDRMCRGDTASGDLRFQRILQALATSWKVELLVGEQRPPRGTAGRRYWQILEDSGVRVVPSQFYSKIPLWCQSQTVPYDWLIAEFWWQGERLLEDVRAIRGYQKGLRFAVDTVDVHYLRELAASECGKADYGTPADILERKQRELATYRAADLLLTVTAEDADALSAESGIPATVLAPNVIETIKRVRRERGNKLLFVGGFNHLPNVDAIRWFAHEIFPLVRNQFPDATLDVVGSHPPPVVLALQDLPGIRVVGFVQDTKPWLESAAVSIAPLRYGAGMKGKVTEALSAGMPVVTTTIGAQGLGATTGVHLKVADDNEEFAAAIVECFMNPGEAHAMGEQGRTLVESICGRERVGATLLAAFGQEGSLANAPSVPILRLSWVLAKVQVILWMLRGEIGRVKRRVLSMEYGGHKT